MVQSLNNSEVTLSAPVGARTLPFAVQPQLLDSFGSQVAYTAFASGDSLFAWLDPAGAVTALQKLPPIAALEEIPSGLDQPAPTEERRPFGALSLITRAGWGAAPSPIFQPGGEDVYDPDTNPSGWFIYPPPVADWLDTIVVHHAALAFYHGPQAIQRLHVLEKRFADVGYHFFIDGLGQIYEGRPLSVRGAHTFGRNTGSIGICLLGNFERVQPPLAQQDTLQALVSELAAQYPLVHLGGHRDYQPGDTVCPGENLWPLLPTVAATAGLQYADVP